MKHLKTLIATCIALNIGSSLAAQDLKRFKLDAFYGIEHVEINNKGTSFFPARNTKQVGQSVGLNVNYGINDRLFVKMGLRVTSLTQTVVSNIFIECGNTTEEEIELVKTRIKAAQYIETALSSAVRYYVKPKKPIFNTYIEGSTDLIFSDEGITPGLGIAYGFEVSLGQKAVVFVQPTYRFRLHKADFSRRLDPNIQQHNVGVAMGLRF
jgi:Outer membrane protein beta-barrel domain